MFTVNNYDFGIISESEKVFPQLSVTQHENIVRDIAINNVLMDYEKELFQTDYNSFVMPIDYNGKISYVEITFTVKKENKFNLENAVNDFEVRKQNTIEKELKEIEVKKMKKAIEEYKNS